VNLKRVRHLIFDFDGTVGDSYGPLTTSFNHVFRHFGLSERPAAELRPWVGTGLEIILEHFLGEERLAEGVRLFRAKYRTVCDEGTRLMPGARETLDALSGRFTMALCSNKPGEILRSLCGRLDASRYFAVIVGAFDAPNMKPHPDLLRAALDRLGATSRDTLYVGDTVTDARFAATCDVPCVLVLGGSGSRGELAAEKPAALLDDIAGLPALLGAAAADCEDRR
jgi:HAD superfamily hydrolase (TIGR01509 family)